MGQMREFFLAECFVFSPNYYNPFSSILRRQPNSSHSYAELNVCLMNNCALVHIVNDAMVH